MEDKALKIIPAPVADGWYSAIVSAAIWKETRKGRLPFLRCRIASGKDSVNGREIDFLVPPVVAENSHFHRFLSSVLGSLDVEKDVDPKVLVGQAVAIRVKRVRRQKREYTNIVAISRPDDVKQQARRKGRRRGQSAARD